MGSHDGITWSQIPSTYTTCGTVVRDPSIAYLPAAQKYWLVHTNSTTTTFDLASSWDGKAWTCIKQVSLAAVVSGTGAAVWAPEWVHDPDGSLWLDTNGTPHVLVAASVSGTSDTGFGIYEVHPTSADFTQWSTPVLLTGSGFPTNLIDPYAVVGGEKFYLFYKNENSRYIELAVSGQLTTGYAITESGDWAGWGTPLEGPSVIMVAPNIWRIYLDAQGNGIYHSESTAGLAGPWSAKS